jgi:hypothetical protein
MSSDRLTISMRNTGILATAASTCQAEVLGGFGRVFYAPQLNWWMAPIASCHKTKFAVDSPLEGDGFEPSVPLRHRGTPATPPPSSGKVPYTHSVGSICDHNLGVFIATKIAMENTDAVPPAHPVPRTPKTAYPGLQRCRAPRVPLTCCRFRRSRPLIPR